MTRELVFVTAGLMLGFHTALPAHAQVSVDVSKITCEQFYKYKLTTADNIAIWLSGFHHGKRNDAVVDAQALKSNAKKLVRYCFRNPETLVMQAVESVLGEKK
jgi:hypothetical protein